MVKLFDSVTRLGNILHFGQHLQALGYFERACKCWAMFLYIVPDHSLEWFNLGLLYNTAC